MHTHTTRQYCIAQTLQLSDTKPAAGAGRPFSSKKLLTANKHSFHSLVHKLADILVHRLADIYG
jgi:hypothetical protein